MTSNTSLHFLKLTFREAHDCIRSNAFGRRLSPGSPPPRDETCQTTAVRRRIIEDASLEFFTRIAGTLQHLVFETPRYINSPYWHIERRGEDVLLKALEEEREKEFSEKEIPGFRTSLGEFSIFSPQ